MHCVLFIIVVDSFTLMDGAYNFTLFIDDDQTIEDTETISFLLTTNDSRVHVRNSLEVKVLDNDRKL